MKSKSLIAALLAVFTLGMTTSCEDMFNIDSNRVVYNPEINTTADSAYYTLGVLQCVRKVADRYVILGEVRGDMAQIDEEETKTSLRNLANFNFEADNEYLNVSDYYSIINNCNYALAHMDTLLTLNNKKVMMDEYAALLGIRAWTYLQLAINYGEVPYYTYPVVSESDVERAYADGYKDIKYIASDLALQLEPYLDVELPSFAGTSGLYPVLRLVLADLYLWSGDYARAKECYDDYFMNNKKSQISLSDENGTVMKSGYVEFSGEFMSWDGMNPKGNELPLLHVSGTSSAVALENEDYISGIAMETEISSGLVSEVSSLFTSAQLQPSAAWKSLSANQWVFDDGGESATSTTKSIKASDKIGDMRKFPYLSTMTIKNEVETKEYDIYTKHSNTLITTQRRTIACLRWAEAMNALAREQYVPGADSLTNAPARANALNAFYLLKDAFKVFFPEGSQVWTDFERFHDELQATYIGVHARGTGDVYNDTAYYVLKPDVIASRLGKTESEITFNDTIEYIDELIIDELALESTLEGNRFGDLVRFAKRRQAWGDANYHDFLAGRVADRSGERNDSLYNKLNGSEEYWYLPFK